MESAELLRLVPEAPAPLCAILESLRDAVEPPIRSEIFGPQRFAQHGRSLGETHRAASNGARMHTFFPRLRSNIEALRLAHLYIGRQALTGYDISPAAEWLLDNFHLIEAQLKEIHEGLPRSYFRTLPVLLDEPLAGLPRVYGVAWAFVAHTDGAFDEDLLMQFLNAYQDTRELNLSEMWALPTTLRVVLIENLRRLALRVAGNKAAREVANLCCDRIEDYTVERLDRLLALLNRHGVGRVFLMQMAQRLQDRRTTADTKLQDWLRDALPDLATLQTQQPIDQAADNLSVSNAVTSLRAIGDADWPDIVARTSALMRLMLTSPVFEAEHIRTRDQTLHDIELLARRCGHSEVSVAQSLLARMRSADPCDPASTVPSYWLRGRGRPALLRDLNMPANAVQAGASALRRLALPLYLGATLLGTGLLIEWLLRRHGIGSAWTVPGIVLMLFPASEAVLAVIHRLISESARPRYLPRLALVQGIPAAHRVMTVIPAMLTDSAAIQALLHRLQLHYLANPEREAQFALLTDWRDADEKSLPEDQPLLDEARRGLQELNRSFPEPVGGAPRFILLHRERSLSPTERKWIGWERKRGKLELLIAALAEGQGRGDAFLDLGDDSRIAPGIRYLVTLDSDTQSPPGLLRDLVGVAAHPHNHPQLDDSGRHVVGGYGILQPRLVTPLPDAREFTPYHWLFAGQCGIDPYSAASSEVYQDVFGEGTFTGKGLLHVDAAHAVLSRRVPEGQVLSHDLFEGSLARCAAVTDITLIEDAPFHADVAAARVHRWTRGDWQLLPFLAGPLSRSLRLRAINRWKMFDNLRRSLVGPMSLALLILSLAGLIVSPWAALGLVAAAYGAGPLMGAIAGFSPSRDAVAKRHFYRQAGIDLARAVCGGLWHLGQLLPEALLALDAIVRALYRMAVSRRHLLQWTTAAAAQAQAKTMLGEVARQHAKLPLLSLLLWVALMAGGTPHPWLSTLVCLVWAAAPIGIWWFSCPRPLHREAPLSPDDQVYLEGVARDAWRLFERCVGPQDNHLPPDNLQTVPYDMVAHRTSPTNIGLYLLSTACARQFGWIGIEDMLARLEATLATLATLERHRGHFLNWYDTQSRAALAPAYVSTVDSGNLSGHLLAIAQACLELTRDPAQASYVTRLNAVAQSCEKLAWEADYSFLYNRKRHLFHIGFRVAEQQLDAGFYDLLISESRLTSLLAIAKGDVPVRHWVSLGRPFYASGADAGLRSWSGSMFEYLMPFLVLDEPRGSVLREACRASLREQIAYTAPQGLPWGISESAYAASDHTLAYQYSPQGVPRLALRRTPPDELVIAPYATALAAQIAPHAALMNFKELERRGGRGAYGFIEALDFTPARQTGSDVCTPVSTFMAHHQGMTIVSLANLLLGAPARRWGMANPRIEAVSSLLQERTPREIFLLYDQPSALPVQALERRPPGLLRDLLPGTTAIEPTHVLSNGRYSVSLRSNGAGWSRWGTTGITRWRDDALRDAHGSFFYLRWHQQPEPVSITQHPAADSAAIYQSVFHADRVCFDAAWPQVRAHTTVWVSPEDDIEFRQVELRNASDRPLEIELMSAFEVTLSEERADEAHPAFTNLFVSAEWHAEQRALMFERRPRLPTEPAVQAAHFLADTDPQIESVRLQTDRLRWLGRNRLASRPQAEFDPLPAAPAPGEPPQSTVNTGLDPVCALSVRLRIAPRGKAQLTFATTAADSRDKLRAVIDKYRQASHVQRASLMSATLTGIRLRDMQVSAENFAAIQSLTTALAQTLARPSPAVVSAATACDRRLLWRFGISGDRPLILVAAGVLQGLGLLRSLAQALRLWSWGGIACDLVVVNSEPASYQMTLQREIAALRDRHVADNAALSGPAVTGLHLLSITDLSPDDLSTLQNSARVRLNADGRPLAHHVQEWIELHEHAFEQRLDAAGAPVRLGLRAPAAVPPSPGLFDAVTGEFRFDVGQTLRPPRPWINVLSNPQFGAQLSEAGGGYTWALNSRLNQLTAWSNDPVADPPSEWFLLQDRRSQEVWSMTPSAWGDGQATYHVSHGQGYTSIRHRRGEVDASATWCVDPQSSVKQVRLRIVNRSHRSLHLRAIGMVEWLMGANRSDRGTTRTQVHQERMPSNSPNPPADAAAGAQKLTALLCTQGERSAGFGEGTAFLALSDASQEARDWTCDRREFFDSAGQFVLPERLGQRSGAGLDPCAALSTRFSVAPGDTVECVFLLGYAENPDAARQLAARAAAQSALQRFEASRQSWDRLLQATTVQTPDPTFDVMVNRWLLYQTVTCRLWAKAGFYQAGGATGFRDQLQDAMALAWADPATLRAQILLGASRQFAEGDVQHWWHAPNGAGVRTHFSDDLLWLPYACATYLRATGDQGVFDEEVPFIEGQTIPDGAEDVYDTPRTSEQKASVYEHAARAVDRSLRVGEHGLPLMGTGDWNDGMNRVGSGGRGESVWLAWFLCRLVVDFLPVARQRGDDARVRAWEAALQGWKTALQDAGWDGHWFRRAFFDNGEPLGSQANAEARIDLIAQAWAVLSDAAPDDLQRQALDAMEQHLVDPDAGLLRLLDPPLAQALPSAGYIQAYPPGVRENGGQYSHAAVWALMAQAEYAKRHPDSAGAANAGDLVWRYFTYLSPAHRAQHPTRGPVYGIEPYVMAGDIYSQPPYVGRGGWSWYTGSAAWLHRAAIESMFGLDMQAESLRLVPCLPSDWPRAEITLTRDGRKMRFILIRAARHEAVARSGQFDARLLGPGESVRWRDLPDSSCFVVPLERSLV